jgi:peptidoglycan/LPS O-acetylase OafA/YrhL
MRSDLEPRGTAEAVRPSRSRYYRPELDFVRFLAFFLVFASHTLPSTRDPRVVNLLKGFTPAFSAFPPSVHSRLQCIQRCMRFRP